MSNPTLTLNELLLIRKWLRLCHQTSVRKQHDSSAAELATLVEKISALIAITPLGGNANGTTKEARQETR